MDEAIARVVGTVRVMGSELIPIAEASGRVLAEPIDAPIDLPSFTCSAVDGYAIRGGDPEGGGSTFRLVGHVAAGETSSVHLRAGEAVRVFTGSKLPQGADTVVMQEDVQVAQDQVTCTGAIHSESHVRAQGEELRAGTRVFESGRLVTAPVIGAIANLGVATVTVYRRPKVGILSTGSELVPLGQPLGGAQVYASNAVAVSAALSSFGVEVGEVRVVDDAPNRVRVAMKEMLPEHDAIVTCGGVSVGDHDLVRKESAMAGVEEVLWRVAMKPGKPFFLGTTEAGKTVFGLPGNPVSALVCLYVLVRPGLARMMGLTLPVTRLSVHLAEGIKKQKGRTEFLRANLSVSSGAELTATPLGKQGSHMATGLAEADCLVQIDAERDVCERGEIVSAIPLSWSLV